MRPDPLSLARLLLVAAAFLAPGAFAQSSADAPFSLRWLTFAPRAISSTDVE